MRIVALSDTHGFHRDVVVPSGDILIHAGDITNVGEPHIALDFAAWLAEQPHTHKIVVPGNHDYCFDISKERFSERAIDAVREVSHFLIDRTVTLAGLKFYGSPWVPNLAMWAFWDRGRDKFESAPTDVDVLVTHGPPDGVRDWVPEVYSQSALAFGNTHLGSYNLRRYVNRCHSLKAHVFGHVHEGYGHIAGDSPQFVNAAICTREYKPTNAAIVIEVES